MHDAEKSRPKDEAIDSEATSKDTVKDLDEVEGEAAPTDSGKSPSPDGSFDDTTPNKDAGPM